MGLSWAYGTGDLGFWDLWRVYLDSSSGLEQAEQAALILFSIRAPRVVLAMLCGAASAAAGVISQGLFRNDLATPTLLGVSQGAALAAILVFYMSSLWLQPLLLPLAALGGAFLSSSLIFALSWSSRGDTASGKSLLLSGCALSSLLSAVASLFLSFLLSDWEKAAALLHWLMGSFSGRSWEHVALSAVLFVPGTVLAMSLSSRLDLLSFGEPWAKSLGVAIPRLQFLCILSISVLEAVSVVGAGSLPFVGLIVPHLNRMLLGSKHRPLLVFSLINGMTLALLADTCARFLFAPREIEVGILTSLLGAPFFLFILRKKLDGTTSP